MKHITILAAIAALVIAGCGAKDEAGTTGTETTTTGGTAKTTAGAVDEHGRAAGSHDDAKVVAVGYATGSKKVGDKGACAVCTIKEGKVSDDEEAKAVLDYEGKTYVFCDDAEKAEFISDPKKFVGGS